MTGRLAAAAALALIPWLAPASAEPPAGVETVHVYKPDGTRHCDETGGTSLDAMARELVEHGISVYARRKSYDGREGVAVCGRPTGGINVYEIAAADLPRARELGFQRLDPSWIDTR